MTIVSNASLDTHPENTLTKFSNVLPRQVEVESGRVLCVKLLNLTICQVLRNEERVQVIYLHLNELKEQRTSDGFSNVIGRIRFKKGNGGYTFHTFEHQPILELQTRQVRELNVYFTTDGQSVLELKDGPPTFVTIELSDNMEKAGFNITCRSSDAITFFEDNSVSRFKTMLPTETNIAGWEVALQNIIFPSRLQARRLLWIELDGQRIFTDVLSVKTFSELTRAVNENIRENNFGEIVHFAVNKQGLGLKLKDETAEPVFASIDPQWARMSKEEEVRERSGLLAGQNFLKLDGPMDFSVFRPSTVLLLHSNIVRESIVGNLFVQLLHICPVSNHMKKKTSTYYEPEKLLFHHTIDMPVKVLEFDFREPDGTAIDLYSDDDEPVEITLLFRPIGV